ncbi:hypothetical protein UFOVP707_33 [uncultured Caudovirales phage]|uniref:Holin of 3TMs, for gene-transfer release n=1 Tax=uncultured Caudovirales phage TaxID=2100421 RepID=A0A6J5NJA3_9CAUD|nr:hypothetical protein UFOVP707_33 [uncultured Caudovirales phage]
MIEVLSLVAGGVMRLMPEVFGYFKAKRDADHEYRMTQLQLDIDKARAQQALDLAHAQGRIAMDQAEMEALVAAIQSQGKPSGVPWVDAVSSAVRPLLTIWWCLLLYTVYKGLLIAVGVDDGLPVKDLAPIVVDDFDRAVIGSIFSFWFVDRSLRRRAG